jgi:hypothetical protein
MVSLAISGALTADEVVLVIAAAITTAWKSKADVIARARGGAALKDAGRASNIATPVKALLLDTLRSWRPRGADVTKP